MGPTWGSQITDKAILAVLVFFIVVVAYITVPLRVEDGHRRAGRRDPRPAGHGRDLFADRLPGHAGHGGGRLTILGYSLYDTVVVFDRVGENTKGFGASGRMTYEDVVNLSMNQTLARSINTSLVAILPVLSVLVIGAQLLGATTLQYFGLALVIGLTSGAYSSIFIASPHPGGDEGARAALRQHPPEARANRADRGGLLTPRAAALLDGSGAIHGPGRTRARRGRAGGGQAPGRGPAAGQRRPARPAPATTSTMSRTMATTTTSPRQAARPRGGPAGGSGQAAGRGVGGPAPPAAAPQGQGQEGRRARR